MTQAWEKFLSREYFSEFQGRGVIVAGGASGIGAALAEGLRWLGAKVVVVDRVAAGGDAVMADLADEGDRRRAMREACEKAGPLHSFISTLGYDLRIDFDAVTQGQIEQLLRVNFIAPILAARDVMPTLRAAGGGAMCLFTSRHGSEIFEPDMMGYGAAKAALDVGLKRLAIKAGQENTPENIVRVFGFCPGWVQTDSQRTRFSQRHFEEAAREQLIPHGMMPEDIVAPVVFALSRHAGLYTGTTLRYDGGEGQIKNGGVADTSKAVRA